MTITLRSFSFSYASVPGEELSVGDSNVSASRAKRDETARPMRIAPRDTRLLPQVEIDSITRGKKGVPS